MKTLHLRRHSLKDGVNDTIGPKGQALAQAEGRKKTALGQHEVGDGPDAMYVNNAYVRIFHGVLIRTLQTAYAFAQGLGYTPTLMPMVTGLGDGDLFKTMVNDMFKTNVKAGMSNFDAVINAHGLDQVKIWANTALDAVRAMFKQMEDGETAIGFFHSPTIELAAWAAANFDASFNPAYTRLADLEGLVFTETDIDSVIGPMIEATEKIAVKTPKAEWT